MFCFVFKFVHFSFLHCMGISQRPSLLNCRYAAKAAILFVLHCWPRGKQKASKDNAACIVSAQTAGSVINTDGASHYKYIDIQEIALH